MMEVRSWIHHLHGQNPPRLEVILDAEFEPGTEHEGLEGDLCQAFGGEAKVFVCAVFFWFIGFASR